MPGYAETGPGVPAWLSVEAERDHWAETATMWAEEATRRARFIGVANALAEALRREMHGRHVCPPSRHDCVQCDALALYDDEWAALRAAHNQPDSDGTSE